MWPVSLILTKNGKCIKESWHFLFSPATGCLFLPPPDYVNNRELWRIQSITRLSRSKFNLINQIQSNRAKSVSDTSATWSRSSTAISKNVGAIRLLNQRTVSFRSLFRSLKVRTVYDDFPPRCVRTTNERTRRGEARLFRLLGGNSLIHCEVRFGSVHQTEGHESPYK